MSETKLSKAYSQYGASMGRGSQHAAPDSAIKFRLERVRLDSGGYDNGGAYWGHGSPLFHAWGDDGDKLPPLPEPHTTEQFKEYCARLGEICEADFFLRAQSRDAAKAAIREQYPQAKFYR